MLGASRRSLCVGAAARRHAAVFAVSSDAAATTTTAASPAHPPRSEPGVSRHEGKRLFSVLAAPKLNGVASLKLRESALVPRRYESSTAAVDSSDAPPAEKFEYQAEVNRLMDLIVHSLYSNKEVFLRELVSNASDALDKLRYLSVTEADLLKDGSELYIRIQTDKDNGIITITMVRLQDSEGSDRDEGEQGLAAQREQQHTVGGKTTTLGRIGDSPLIDAGTYACVQCAVSCTGEGEAIIRSTLARDVAAVMEYKGLPLQEAVDFCVKERLDEGFAGLIAVSGNGEVAYGFNCTGMFRGCATEDVFMEVGIWERATELGWR